MPKDERLHEMQSDIKEMRKKIEEIHEKVGASKSIVSFVKYGFTLLIAWMLFLTKYVFKI